MLFRTFAAYIKLEVMTDHSVSLGRLLKAEQSGLEGAGVRITGYGGGSPEGPVWQYDFSRTWALPPDTATVRIYITWASYHGHESEDVSVTRFAEIYRQGQLSSFKDVKKQMLTVAEFLKAGIGPLVTSALTDGEKIIAARGGRT